MLGYVIIPGKFAMSGRELEDQWIWGRRELKETERSGGRGVAVRIYDMKELINPN